MELLKQVQASGCKVLATVHAENLQDLSGKDFMKQALEYGSFEQLNLQITRYFRNWSIYVGGENLTDFTQKNPIINADNPWGDTFDSSMIWGPMHGRKIYIGLRWNLPRN